MKTLQEQFNGWHSAQWQYAVLVKKGLFSFAKWFIVGYPGINSVHIFGSSDRQRNELVNIGSYSFLSNNPPTLPESLLNSEIRVRNFTPKAIGTLRRIQELDDCAMNGSSPVDRGEMMLPRAVVETRNKEWLVLAEKNQILYLRGKNYKYQLIAPIKDPKELKFKKLQIMNPNTHRPTECPVEIAEVYPIASHI